MIFKAFPITQILSLLFKQTNMKQAKLITLTLVIMVTAFCAVVYTSCTKDKCSGVSCLNGGYCNGGNCICPVGFVGFNCENVATTTVTYNNNTYTTVTLIFNNSSTITIAPGTSASFTGSYGDNAVATASTSGPGGDVISWSFTDLFPASGAVVENLDVSSSFFFLEVANNSSYTIGEEDVNKTLTSQLDDYVSVPTGGNTYGIGYYPAYSNSNVYLYSVGGSKSWSYTSLNLPFSMDQSCVVTATN